MIIWEVGPRDGLQGLEKIATDKKVRFIDLLSETGLKHIEVVSFVNPKYIRQMADAVPVAQQIRRRGGIVYSALVPSLKFYEQAVEANIPEIAVFLSANEEHNKKNLGSDIATTKEKLSLLIEKAIRDERRVRGYVSTVWGYHAPDDTHVSDVIAHSQWLLDQGVYQVSLGDTEGVSTPETIMERLRAISDNGLPLGKFALHYHTRSEDLQLKVDAGYEMGVRIFDSSTGGLGGCPTDPLLANADTLELVKHFENNSISTGVDIDKLEEASRYVKDIIA